MEMSYSFDTSKIAMPQAVDFAAQWGKWRSDKLLPQRKDVDLRDIKLLLPMIVILERRAGGEFFFRLTGTMADILLGDSMIGTNVGNITASKRRQHWLARINLLVDQPCGLRSLHTLDFGDFGQIEIEIVAIPIEPDNASHDPQIMLYAAFEDPKFMPRNDRPVQKISPALAFDFLDIGAGVPDAIPMAPHS